MRRPRTPCRTKRGWNLNNFHSHQSGFYDHLGRELHARRPKIHPQERASRKCTQTTVKISRWTSEEKPADPCQKRVPYITMLPRHCAPLDATEEAIAHNKISASSELFYKITQAAKIVTVV
jgi:hypothetical protein